MRKLTLPCTTWFEAIKCWTDPGECNDDYPVEEHLGTFSTLRAAQQAGKKAGLKLLTETEYMSFQMRRGPDGCFIKKRLFVFLGRSRSIGTVVEERGNIALTNPRSQRRR